MDVAIGGDITKGYQLRLGRGNVDEPASDRMLVFYINNGQMVREHSSQISVEGPTFTQYTFANLRFEINRGANETVCNYYWNGELAETSSFKKYNGWSKENDEFQTLYFYVVKDTSENAGMYIDNLKIYTQ